MSGASPLPAVEVERYVNAIVNRLFTSREVLADESKKVTSWQVAFDSETFPDFLRKKFNKLSTASALIESCEFAQAQIDLQKKKKEHAEELLDMAHCDFDLLVDTLADNTDTGDMSQLTVDPFRYLVTVKTSNNITWDIVQTLSKQKKATVPEEMQDVTTLPP
eukprot:scpid109275/ scgid31911/ 